MAKGKHQTDRHHRKPRSIGGQDVANNISIVNKRQHEAYHHLFSNMSAPAICAVLNETWLDPDYEITIKRRTKCN